MEILIGVAAKVAEYTVAPIGRQAGYLIFYKGYFKKLADDIKELEDARERINHLVEEERRNGRVIESEVLNWLKRVNEVIEKANQLQKDPRHGKVGCSGSSFPNLLFRHQLSRNAKKMAIVVAEVQEKGMFDRVGYLPALDVVDSYATTSGSVRLETRELHKEDIMRALRDPKVYNIGVYGLGGVGKTNLVKKISQIAKLEKLFEVVVMANVSKTPDIKTIQGEIADLLGLRFEEETIAGRANRLIQRIVAEKTILVILDDIWTKLDLEKVGIPFGNEHNGCKILMTSRSKEVLLEMDAQKDFTFRLDVLNEEETWNLFLSMAGNVVKDISLQDIATQVAQKCAGLPLRIVTIARALKNKDVHAWKDALRQLDSVDHVEMDALTYSALELSYNWLENDEIKALFLLFAVLKFRRAECLLKVAIGLNIFKRINTVDDARNRLYKLIGSLKASCLLLEGNTSQQIQMHDIVREVAISIASRDQHVFVTNRNDELKKWPTKDFLNRCTQIILKKCHIHELPQRLDCPNIKYFFLRSDNHSLELPDTIFEGMGSLKVLDLAVMNLSSLPTSFRSLTNLQTLCLKFSVLENMDAIGALKNLEILSLRKSSMVKLPSEIKKLTRLRMLDLSYSRIEVIPPNIISSLTQLEELYIGNTSIKWEIENSTKQNENASIAELRYLSNLTALKLQIHEAWILPRDLKLMFEKLKRYKIVIGDVWEWSDIADGTLKTLKLKLGTNIHLEHGIKALIKGVENLYLDEVDGIWNVLYQLNGEGFPLLKHLHVQNNAKIKHIVDSLGRNQVQVSFPHLETLVLHNLQNLEQICHGPLAVNSFGKLSIIKVKNCIQLKYLLSFSMVKGLFQLSEIQVCQCNSMKKVVLGDGDSCTDNNIVIEKVEFLSIRSLTLQDLQTLDNFFSYELMSSFTEGQDQRCETSVPAPFFSAQVAFPNLDTLKLSSLNLNKIWDDNQHSVDNLTNLIVENCGRLKYLFSSTMVESFMNLKRLEISKCHLMDEIIATKVRNNGSSAMKEVRFSKLETIILKDMENLKTIWHHQFNTLKMLQVQNCDKIVVVFPSSMQKTYDNLEVLEVTNCASMEKIFELTVNEKSNVEDKTHLKKITLDGLPKLKNTWNKDPQGILSFHTIENIYLRNCGSLEYLFPLSVATYCSHLKELCIKWCGNMKEIVAEKKESVCTTPIFEFNQLNTLRLWSLHKLKGFYVGNHTLACPSLITIDVSRCAKLNLFKIFSTPSLGRFQNGKPPVSVEQSLFIIEEVIPNLKKLTMGPRDANMILQAKHLSALFTKMKFLKLSNFKNEETAFPYWFLQNVPSLEVLNVEWSSFTKIFQDERLVREKNCTRLKRLTLNQLPKLQNICEEGSQLDPVLEVLEYLLVIKCPIMRNLLPSKATFSHMTYLEITDCNGLVYLITSHTARSLANLRTMKVKNCNSLEEIMTGKEDVGIEFVSLEILELENLPRLNKFCSSKCCLNFPLLEEVIVRECARMKIFSEGNTSTPNLRKVKIAENDEERLWKGDLNGTINNMFEDKAAFGSFQSLKLSEYPELKELWYGKLQNNIFRGLKHLEVHECDFLSDVLFQPNLLEVLMNLEELDVRDCTSLEAVFDVKSKFTTEILMKNSTRLKKLTLSSLPKLKHVWKEDPHETLSFQNLCEISVMKCKSLTSLFPFSVATDIIQLQNLQVRECGIEEIVAKEEGTEDIINFMFPHLTSLDLRRLPKLKAFFTGIHSLRCKSLKRINVFNCPKLELFKTEPMIYQERARDDKLYVSNYQPLFTIEEVLANVEKLALNNKDFDMILQSQYSGDQFIKLKSIIVSRFTNEEATFPYWFMKNVPSLEKLVVQWSSFTEIFKDEELVGDERNIRIHTRLRELTLYQLHGLRHICKEGFRIDPVLQLLETIDVEQCCSLINLLPSSATFIHLTCLTVKNCDGLINLIAWSTAKSLVKLTTMKIEACNLLEDVVNGKEDETNNDIEFCNLQTLELISLPRLHRFCPCKCFIKFPLLEDVVVKECPRMQIFSSGDISIPNLQKVQIEDGEEYCWEGDLNGTIKNMFEEKAAFGSFQSLKLSEYPELKELWYGKLQNNIFRGLKHLEVHECDFLSDVLFQPNLLEVLMNLEELDVRDCTSLEAVFDVKSKFTTEILMKNSTRLKKLTLSSLPKLKHVWKEDPHETLSFQNLCEISVMKCKSLTSLFPFSVATDIIQLQNLQVHECGIEEIVAKEEGTEDIINFMFPHLTSLDLRRLPKLKAFFTGIHSLRCKSLKRINVFNCPKLELFKTEPMIYQERARDDKLYVSNYQPLFTIEEVLANVEKLALNNKDFDMILQSQYSGDQFIKLKSIIVSRFTNEEATFPYWFMKNVPSLEKLVVQWSSFTEIFKDEELVGDERNIRIHTRLRELTLYQLHGLRHICKEGFRIDPVLQLLETIDVEQCCSLINLLPSSATFIHLTCLTVKNCDGLINLIAWSTAKSLVKLTTMKIEACNLLEDVVNGKEDETNNDIEFCNLQTLELISLPRLHRFCPCKCFIKFPLLEDVVVKECPRMQIFSSGDISIPNLQKVQIEDGEEYCWEGDLNGTIKNMFEEKAAFGSFQSLKLSEYPELKELWYGKLQNNIFRGLKHLEVHECDFLSDVLFQPNLLEVLMNLEELDVRDCTSLEAVFDVKSKFTTEILMKNSTRLKKLTLSSLPKLKHVWKEDPHETLSFQNLCEISVMKCKSLTSLFPFSVATDIIQLQNLQVHECGIEEIVAKEEGTEDIINFMFPHLTSLDLRRLPKLKAFFTGIHSLRCKSLKRINVFNCPKLELFKTEPMIYQERARDDKLYVSNYQPLFTIEEVLANVEKLALNNKDFDMILQSQYSGDQFIKLKSIIVSRFTNEEATFPYWFMKNVPSLEKLVVQWSSFTEIFKDEELVGDERNIRIHTRLRELTLYQLHGLRHICKEGFRIDPVLQLLETIDVEQCCSLINLLPSSATFIHLTCLTVKNCDGLINLIAWSTAKSLVKLTTMKIEACNLLEDVVNGKEDETNNDIEFCNLQTLELISLPRLHRFCPCKCFIKFPLLEDVVVKECPRMQIFSSGDISIPNLQKVQIEDGEEYCWEGDLNGTIKNMFEEKAAFGSFQSLKLSEYPELKELWYGKLQNNIFRGLKHLEVHECDFLSDVLFQPNLLEVLMNLEELDVRDCTSLEAVFDVKSKFTTEILMKNSTRLKKLTLSSLPKLKHVWKEDPHETLSFQNLCEISVMKCKSLTSLFPFSVATDIIQLQNLQVHECGIEEIVAKEEGTEDIINFMFPHLTSLDLRRLPKLKAFFTGIHSLRCKSLKRINVFNCPKLELFKTEPMIYQERARDDKLYVSNYQPLFTIEEVLANVEKLALNNKDFDMILQSQYSGDQFIKLKSIIVSRFTNEEATFPYWFMKNVPSLEKLVVQWSSFTEIFKDEELVGDERNIRIHTRLRELTLYQLHGLRHICKEGFRIDPVLQLLETIDVEQCCSLINLLPSSATFIHLTCLTVKNCDGLINLIAWSTAKSLVKLTTMKIEACNLLEDVVNGKEDETNNDIEFCNLQTLELISLPRLHRFCPCKCFIKFPLLEDVVVKECPRMQIFSSGDISIPNLQKVQIEDGEEYCWEGDLNGTIKNMFEEKAAFGSFQSLKLSEYPELKELWYGKLQNNIFRGLKHLEVHECDFLSDVLFQPNLLEVLMNLEELDVRDCTSLEAVFDVKSKFTTEILMKNSTRLKKLTLSSLPKLKHVWKEDPHETLSFQNLCEISVMKCKSLTSLFPFSVATDIIQLQNLQVRECGIEEIVAKEEGTEDIINFMFPHLTSLDLRRLPKLKAFFTGIHSLRCKSLKRINVFNCPKLELFKTEPMIYQERARDDKLYVSNYQPLFTIEEVLANVEKLALNNKDFDMILQSQYSGDQFIKLKSIIVSRFTNEEATFPYWFMKNVPSLEKLVVQWSSFTEIFKDEELVGDERNIRIHTRLRELTLYQLHGLRHICKEGFRIDPVLQLLETIDVEQCCSLINLLPSSATFIHLTCLTVSNCNGLINLIACSTAKSLVKLTTMKIEACNLLEDVVNGKEDEANNDIEFCNLQTLKLISLPRLHRFCPCKCFIKFPLLEEVVVKECPRMQIFSSGDISIPNLQKVQIEDGEEYCWEGDLNGTIKNMFEDKVAFYKLKHLNLSEYPELKDLWYGQLHHNVFCNLKSLVVHRCDFLSSVLFPSNVFQVLHGLEELEVRDCDSLETVFDVKGVRSKEILVKQTAKLKRLTLFGLPKLKHIWNEDPHKIISFGNLCIVAISECQSLSNIFSLSLCKDLGHLEMLKIKSCGVEEIVAIEEGSIKNSFYFPQLTELRLLRLAKLKSFYPGKHTLECPSLKILSVYCCDALRMFSFNHLDFKEPDQVDEIHEMDQALFSIEKISPNLEELALDGKDALRILNGCCQENLFNKVELLRLQCFDETPTTYMNCFHAIFPNLATLQVRRSSFDTLFLTEGMGHFNTQSFYQIKKLWLYELEQLRYIWQEDFPLDHLVHGLEVLYVINCPNLISMVPSSTSLKNLTILRVDNCKGLIYLMTSSTARSLVQLTRLVIKNCEIMLDVVKIDEEKAEEDIIFENLEYLEFSSLASFRSFCYGKHKLVFPSLLRFVVKGCPQMKIFSSRVTVAPFLTAIEVENKRMRWKDDLNTTIEQLFIEQEVSRSDEK